MAGRDKDLVHALGTERGLHEVANGNSADEGGLAGAQAGKAETEDAGVPSERFHPSRPTHSGSKLKHHLETAERGVSTCSTPGAHQLGPATPSPR